MILAFSVRTEVVIIFTFNITTQATSRRQFPSNARVDLGDFPIYWVSWCLSSVGDHPTLGNLSCTLVVTGKPVHITNCCTSQMSVS
jgi:hypothetical protein